MSEQPDYSHDHIAELAQKLQPHLLPVMKSAVKSTINEMVHDALLHVGINTEDPKDQQRAKDAARFTFMASGGYALMRGTLGSFCGTCIKSWVTLIAAGVVGYAIGLWDVALNWLRAHVVVP